MPASSGLPAELRSLLRSGAPRFARELFGPVLGFYAGYELWGLTAGIVIATVVALAIEAYERKHGRRGALALVSAAFVVIQGVVGLIADSAVVYLAQPVIVSAIWAVAYLVSAAIGRPLMGVFADAWYPFPDFVKRRARTERLRLRVGRLGRVPPRPQRDPHARPLSGSIGGFVAIQFVTGFRS